MLNASVDAIRDQVDDVRGRLEAGEIDPASAEAMLAASIPLTAEVGGSALTDDHSGRGLHLCPWSTCQATRHN